jgi:hypothetical protein
MSSRAGRCGEARRGRRARGRCREERRGEMQGNDGAAWSAAGELRAARGVREHDRGGLTTPNYFYLGGEKPPRHIGIPPR